MNNENYHAMAKPYIMIKVDTGKPIIKWIKGEAQSIDIYVQRIPLTPFIFLANNSLELYMDTHPLPMSPTIWSYRAIFKSGGEQVGQISNTVSIPVMKNADVGINNF